MDTLFENVSVVGIPLLIVVLGLVEWVKSLGLQGTPVKIVSMLIGLILGILYQFSVIAPVSFSDWFAILIFGLGLGISASGVYSLAKSAVRSAIFPEEDLTDPKNG